MKRERMSRSLRVTGVFLCFLLVVLLTITPAPAQAQAGVDRIYYISNYFEVWSADLDGGNQTQLYVYPDFPIIDGIAVDLVNGYVYIAVEQQGPSFNINSIDRINLDGSGHVQLTNLGGQFPLSVAYSPTENMVYWMEQ